MLVLTVFAFFLLFLALLVAGVIRDGLRIRTLLVAFGARAWSALLPQPLPFVAPPLNTRRLL